MKRYDEEDAKDEEEIDDEFFPPQKKSLVFGEKVCAVRHINYASSFDRGCCTLC